ncbi:unnamed protein product [Prunus brigantina]
MALLEFKKRITEDPLHVMSSWNDSSQLCSWTGVTWIGNFSSLNSLSLGSNNLQGSIPNELGRLKSLGSFRLGRNNLSGMVFVGGANRFTGNIPASLSNASGLQVLDFGFTGKLPGESFGKLQSLVKLNFDENRLGNGKAGSITNLSTQLKILTSGVNMIHGMGWKHP